MSTREQVWSPTWGALEVDVEQRDTGWTVRLAERYPRLGAIACAVGETREQALWRLVDAVERDGSPWPDPPRLQRGVDGQGDRYVRADVVSRVVVTTDEGERDAWAIGWCGQEVWVHWHDATALEGTGWVPAEQVRRTTSGGAPA